MTNRLAVERFLIERGIMLRTQKVYAALAALVLVVATVCVVPAKTSAAPGAKDASNSVKGRVRVPLNLAILVQDDLVPRVGNEIAITRNFISSLPAGSRVMVGYITAGSLQVRQPFTDDLAKASQALRIPRGSTSAAPYNPYVEVIEALRRFDNENTNRNAVLLISDGLDVSRGFDVSLSDANSPDLLHAIREAKKRNVAIYSFYAPTVGLTSHSFVATSFGQSSLNRLSDETGGRAFFQGNSFVTFNPYFEQLRQTLNRQYAPVS